MGPSTARPRGRSGKVDMKRWNRRWPGSRLCLFRAMATIALGGVAPAYSFKGTRLKLMTRYCPSRRHTSALLTFGSLAAVRLQEPLPRITNESANSSVACDQAEADSAVTFMRRSHLPASRTASAFRALSTRKITRHESHRNRRQCLVTLASQKTPPFHAMSSEVTWLVTGSGNRSARGTS